MKHLLRVCESRRVVLQARLSAQPRTRVCQYHLRVETQVTVEFRGRPQTVAEDERTVNSGCPALPERGESCHAGRAATRACAALRLLNSTWLLPSNSIAREKSATASLYLPALKAALPWALSSSGVVMLSR